MIKTAPSTITKFSFFYVTSNLHYIVDCHKLFDEFETTYDVDSAQAKGMFECLFVK